MEAVTGVRSDVWKTIVRGTQRVNEDHINGIANAYPEYVYGIVTGQTLPEVGQISPHEEQKSTLHEAIVSILDAKDMGGVMLTPDQTADLILERLSKQRNVTASEDTEAV